MPTTRGGAGRTAGALMALGLAWLVARWWIDPRFSIIVDDGQHHLLRQYVIDFTLRAGALFPRWLPDLAYGFGYPLLDYYSPGVYYAGAALGLAGAGVYRAVQLVGLLGVLLGAGGAYALGLTLFRRPLPALVLAGVYVCSPYAFVTNLYLRSAVPEAMGAGLLPWVLAGGMATARSRRPAGALLLALPFATLVLFHSLSGIMAAGILVAWLPAVVLDQPAGARSGAARRATLGLVVGLALSAFVWLPPALERGAVHAELGSTGNLQPSQWLFDPLHPLDFQIQSAVPEPYLVTNGAPVDLHWLYPHALTGLSGPAKPGLGQVALLVGALVAAGSTLFSRREVSIPHEDAGQEESGGTMLTPASRRPAPRPRWVLLAASALIAALWLMNTTWTAWVWRTLPLLPVLQFPWRLWGPFALCLACAVAALFAWCAQRGQQQWVLAAVLVAFAAVNALGGLHLQTRFGARTIESDLPAWGTVLRQAEGDRLGIGTTTMGEFMPRSVLLADPPQVGEQGRVAYEATFPEGGWIAGRVWPYQGNITVSQVWATPTWTEARVTVDVPTDAPTDPSAVSPGRGDSPGGALGFRTLVFPGWRAFVDGRPVAVTSPPFDPRIAMGPGFAIVPVPPGEHTVRLQLGPTLSRAVAAVLSLLGLSGALLLLVAGPVSAVGSRYPLLRLPSLVTTAAVAALVLLYVAFAIRTGARPTGRASAQNALMEIDAASAVLRGGAQASSPVGATLGSFLDVRPETLGGQTRRWLYMHPPSRVEVALLVPPRAVFQAGLGLDPEGWTDPAADGVQFVLEVITGDGTVTTLLDQVVQPQVNDIDRGWRYVTLDLSAYAGQRVTLRLRTEGRDTPNHDWAGWADPVVYRDLSARYPPPAAVAPAPLPRLP